MENSLIRYVSLVLMTVALTGCVTDGSGYTTGQRLGISCNDSAINITLPPKAGYPTRCTKRNTSEPTLTATVYFMFFRFVDEERSYANIHYSEAGDGTFINIRTVTEKMNQSRKVRADARNWGEASELEIGEVKYGYVTFDLPGNRSCIGYNGYRDQRGPGYGVNWYGYLCSQKTQIRVSHLKDFLSHVEIRP